MTDYSQFTPIKLYEKQRLMMSYQKRFPFAAEAPVAELFRVEMELVKRGCAPSIKVQKIKA